MLLTRILTAAVLLPVFLGGLFFLPQEGWAFLLLTLLIAGAWEWAALCAWHSGGRLSFCMVLAVSAAAAYPGFIWNQDASLIILGVAALFWCLIAPFWLYRGWRVSNPWLQAAAGWIVLLPTWLALVQMQKQPWLLLAVLGVVWVADSAAYFAGHRWGRHKLAPAISPGKTWEGVAGAALAVAVYYLLVWNLGFARHAPQHVYAAGMLVGLLFPLSILGDLFESGLKRQAGVKDSGRLLPGHGGVLDRIDALTSTLPLAALATSVLFA